MEATVAFFTIREPVEDTLLIRFRYAIVAEARVILAHAIVGQVKDRMASATTLRVMTVAVIGRR